MTSEDPWPKVESAKIEESLKSALECPVCLEYMTPPITMCSMGHNVCKDCRPRLSNCPTCRQPLLGTRNVALENLARDLALPKKVKHDADETDGAATAVEEAGQEEDYEVILGCPLECAWTGNKENMRNHIVEAHNDKLLDGTDYNKRQWKLSLVTRDTRVIFAYGEVFRYRLRLHTIKKMFFIAVQLVGPPADASKYRYEVEVSSEGQVVVMGNPTLEQQQDLDAAFETGRCVTLDYELVKKVAQGK